jgi:adenine phosphoribosyltransferase
MALADLKSYIRDVPDFPKAGIVFKDITPLLRHAAAFDSVIQQLTERYAGEGITQVVGIESRGFIFGSAIARSLGAGFVPIRKPGKLPWTKRRNEYILEYGSDALEIHDDAIEPNDRVVIIDDLLATGGTALAASTLVREFNATLIGVGVVIELVFLNGREKLGGATPVQSLIRYE